MSTSKKVAVIGAKKFSDVFLRTDIAGLDAAFKLVYASDGTTMVSQMSQPVAVTADRDADPADAASRELDKTLIAELVGAQPDLIVLDFRDDVQNGALVTSDGTVVINKPLLFGGKVEFLTELSLTKSVQDFERYSQLWTAKLEKFMDQVAEFLPETKIVLNATGISESDRQDEALMRLNDFIQANYREIESVALFDKTDLASPLDAKAAGEFVLDLAKVMFDKARPESLSDLKNLKLKGKEARHVKLSSAASDFNLLLNDLDFSSPYRKWRPQNEEDTVLLEVPGATRRVKAVNQLVASTPIALGVLPDEEVKLDLRVDVRIKSVKPTDGQFLHLFVFDGDKTYACETLDVKTFDVKVGSWQTVEFVLDSRAAQLQFLIYKMDGVEYRNFELKLA